MSAVILPMGDVFRPYQYDADGKIIERSDTVSPQEAQAMNAAGRSPDVAAILAAENARLQAEIDAK